MPVPLVFALPALYEAAQVTAIAIGTIIGVIAIDEMVEESDKDKENAKVTTADSTKPCEKCPAIPKVVPEQEQFNGDEINLHYQMRICGTYSMRNDDGRTTVEEFAFRDPRLGNDKKKVKFDGWKPEQCLFLEAKGRLDQFFAKDGTLLSWYTGDKKTMEQANRQQNTINLCEHIPECHWHFMQSVSYRYYKKALSKHSGIRVFHTL